MVKSLVSILDCYVLTLDRCSDRFAACITGLYLSGFIGAGVNVKRVFGKDYLDFGSIDEVVDCIVQDGFPGYLLWHEEPDAFVCRFNDNIKFFCVNWGQLLILRKIAESGNSGIIMDDDALFRLDSAQLLMDILNHDSFKDFEMISFSSFDLSTYWGGNTHGVKQKDFFPDWNRISEFYVEMYSTKFPFLYGNSFFCSQYARVISPVGAERILRLMERFPYSGLEFLPWYTRLAGLRVSDFYTWDPLFHRIVWMPDWTVEGGSFSYEGYVEDITLRTAEEREREVSSDAVLDNLII